MHHILIKDLTEEEEQEEQQEQEKGKENETVDEKEKSVGIEWDTAEALGGLDLKIDTTIVGNTWYLLSQFDIVAFLIRNMNRLSAVIDASIAEIGVLADNQYDHDHDIHTVPADMISKDAFQQLLLIPTDFLVIVDANNPERVVNHISESDVMNIGPRAIEKIRSDPYLQINDAMCAIQKGL